MNDPMTEVTISPRFNGPADSGNGGYCCGVLASFLDGASRVRLHSPPPLDTPMRVIQSQPDRAELLSGEILVGTAETCQFQLDTPPAPTLEQAERASGHFVWEHDHCYPSCFVCGPNRRNRGGLGLAPGSVDGAELVACSWQPADEFMDEKGIVLPEIVWSALDCPGFFGAVGDSPRPMLLGELMAEIFVPVPGKETLIVYGWPLGSEGRKHYGAVAIATRSGEVLASSRTTWILMN